VRKLLIDLLIKLLIIVNTANRYRRASPWSGHCHTGQRGTYHGVAETLDLKERSATKYANFKEKLLEPSAEVWRS
jgi:hypothetical protein